MNWIATAFEQLKARVEAHIPATNKALNDLDQRVTGAETYTQKSVESLEARIAALETSKVTGSCAQPDRAPL
jgi:hypothetical protein